MCVHIYIYMLIYIYIYIHTPLSLSLYMYIIHMYLYIYMYRLPNEEHRAADIARRELRAKGLVAKLTEDLPQLVVQAIGAWIQHRHREKLHPVQIISLVLSFLSLFVEGYAASILTVINVKVSNPTLKIKAEKAKKHVEVFKMMSSNCVEVLVSVALAVMNAYYVHRTFNRHLVIGPWTIDGARIAPTCGRLSAGAYIYIYIYT